MGVRGINNKALEAAARALQNSRFCQKSDEGEPREFPCTFCEWTPDDLTPAFDETGCVYLARAVITAYLEALPSDYTELVRQLRRDGGGLKDFGVEAKRAADAIEALEADRKTWAETAVSSAAEAKLAATTTYPEPANGWTCFHCGETFIKRGAARDHFGATPDSVEGCIIHAGDERGLLMALRKAEARVVGLEAALKKIVAIKSEAIGNTGFATGPAALFAAVQHIARAALEPTNETG